MKLRLVIADDDPIQRKVVAARFRAAGYEVVASAGDGAEALALIREHRPEAVVSDVLMPTLDGFDLCKATRADAELRDIPVFLITNTYVDAADRDLAKLSGARDLILRTPDLVEILAELGKLKAP